MRGFKNVVVAVGLVCASLAAHATTFTYSGPVVPIPDSPGANVGGAVVAAPIAVTGLTGQVANVVVTIGGTTCVDTVGATTVGIEHSFVNDLQISLRAPDGTEVIIIDRTDGGGNNLCQVVLRDGATNSIQGVTTSQAPFSGTYAPANPLAAFISKAPNGNWTLVAQDFFVADTGNIRAWSIDITSTVPVAATPAPVPTAGIPALILSGLGIFGVAGYLSRRRKPL